MYMIQTLERMLVENSGIGSRLQNSLVDQEGFSGTLLACSVVARAMIKGS